MHLLSISLKFPNSLYRFNIKVFIMIDRILWFLRSLTLSQNQAHSQFSAELAHFGNCQQIFPQILGPVTSVATHIQSRKVFFSQFQNVWTPCVLIMIDLQELQDKRAQSGTNPCYSFICSSRSRGLLSITRQRYTQRWRYREESSLNNISVKSWEASNSVKATDIRTNATDVETRKNMVQ